MNHDEWLERGDIYALGALDGDELSRFEAHLGVGCPACEHRLREAREALALLPRSLTAVEPPPALKARLLDQVAREPRVVVPIEARRRPAALWWTGWATALAAAGLLVVVSWNLAGMRGELARLRERVAALQSQTAELDRLRGMVASLQATLATREETFGFLSDPQVRYLSLGGLRPSPGASGWLLWNPATREGLLLTRGLPPAPAGRAYELWAIAGPEPVPAGVFTVDRDGRALLRLPSLPEGKAFDKFAVTLEPAGGVPKPTGAMHLLGSL